jgi:hypothetical protein
MLCSSSLSIEATASHRAEDILQILPDDVGLFAFHLNLTQTASFPHDRSELCRALLRAGIATVNADVTNISKAFIQAACRRLGLPATEAPPEGDPDEMLIVKTNLNYGGLGERSLGVGDLRMLGRGASECAIDAKSYKILKRRDVAHSEWNDPALFIERFVRNCADRFCRAYIFGEHFVISEVVDPSVLKKMPAGIERSNFFFRFDQNGCEPMGASSARLTSLARQIRRFAESLRIDFAALDVVIDDDDRSYIIDVNTTPSWGVGMGPEVETFLRAALNGLIRGEAPVFSF